MTRRKQGASVVHPRPTGRPSGTPRPAADPLSRLLLLGQRRLRIARLRNSLRASLWFLPALALSAAALLSLSTTSIDRHLRAGEEVPLGFVADADSALSLLSLISSWMLTFIGLAFTMTIVVLQLASGQFSPRVIGTFLRDRYSQVALGTFIGTFAYSFMVMREVRVGGYEGEFVPAVSLAVAFALVLVSLGVFIRYVNHVAQSIRAGSVIATVAHETRKVFDQLYPPIPRGSEREDWRPYRTIPAPVGGLLLSYDREALVALARESESVLEIVPRVGEFVPRGAPLVRVVGGKGSVSAGDVLPQISLGGERTMEQDPAFGFRQLVDIAERALSPGVNDPTTAVQVIDQIHDLLRDLLHRELPSGSYADQEGSVRLVIPTAAWEDFLRLGIEEIRHYGADSLQVERRLRAMLDDLLEASGPRHRPAIRRELALLRSLTEQRFPEVLDAIHDPFEGE